MIRFGPPSWPVAAAQSTSCRRWGSVNWPEVRRAFADIGYTGWMTTEVGGGDEAFLRDLAHRVDLIIAGQ